MSAAARPRRIGADRAATVRRAILAAVAALAPPLFAVPAFAQDLALAGRMGDKALLVLAGRSVVLGVGQAGGGVKLVRWENDAAVVEHNGALVRLRVGAAPSRIGAAGPEAAGAREIVIPVGPGGHFVTDGAINGRAVRFVVDTGATLVSMSRAEAARLGLDLAGARAVQAQTAAGVASARMLPLKRVRVGEVEVYDVMALVTEAPMPFVLLGNSFLERFQWRRDNDVMRLARK